MPPEPMAMMPSSGSMTSPVPLMISEVSLSATASSASSLPRRRSVRQSLASSTAARDFRLAHPGGADHEDVLGGDFVAQRFFHLLAAPAVAQGDGDGTLGLGLPDDVTIELGDDLLRGHRAGRERSGRCTVARAGDFSRGFR
jgi:hypothetical protein